MLDLGSAWSTEMPVGSRYRFLRGLDCLLAGLASLFLHLVGAGEEGRECLSDDSGASCWTAPSLCSVLPASGQLGDRSEKMIAPHTYQRRVWRAVWKQEPVCMKQLAWTVLGTV